MTRDMAEAHATARARIQARMEAADERLLEAIDRFRTRDQTHTIDPTTGEFAPIQEAPMNPASNRSRHAELVALLTEIRDRMPEVHDFQPADLTEEPPAGSKVVDAFGHVWANQRERWERWEGGTDGDWMTWEWWTGVRKGAPLRLATPADLARVGILQPAPADDLPGEPVEPGDLRAGDRVEFTWKGQRITCNLVSDRGGTILRSDVTDAVCLTPSVVYRGRWEYGISDVRLIERAPREDEPDPDTVTLRREGLTEPSILRLAASDLRRNHHLGINGLPTSLPATLDALADAILGDESAP